jgi:hypothetical protein
MGCNESAVEHDTELPIRKRGVDFGSLPENFSHDQLNELRKSGTIEAAVQELEEIGTNLAEQDPESLVPAEKSCFVCCNSYTVERLRLGVGPVNDSVTVAFNHKQRGYTVYFLHNPLANDFKTWLAVFLKGTKKALTVFFTGHGASVPDRNGDESDGFDEAMIFDKGYIIDDTLQDIVRANVHGNAKILLLTDCCHSGSIWDLQSSREKLPGNILSLSASEDSQTAKQTKMNKKDQGIFSYFFWKLVNEDPKITPNALAEKINPNLKRFNQKFVSAATLERRLSEPIFDP